MNSIKNCRIIHFDKIGNGEIGYLTALEENRNIPFSVKRVYYSYEVPERVERGFHAHKELEQVLICVNGNLKVKCFDGETEKIFTLDRPNIGLYIGNMVWREIFGYTEGTVLMVLASGHYDESDYLRAYNDFIAYIKKVGGDINGSQFKSLL